jgi:nucleotide-binding universal stress UspA family protein
MVKKILVPVDGSDTAGKALKYAADLAKQTGAIVTLLSVIDSSTYVTRSIPAVAAPAHVIETIEDYLRQAAAVYIDAAKKLCRGKKVMAKSVIRSGHPVEEILKEAKSSGVDLIVMGSHGRSALGATLLGSVTFGVIHRDTTFPVLVVRR